jgi:hypothetical protein
MRTSCTRVLMLVALFAFFTVSAGSAQTLQTRQKVPTKAEFLATLAGDLNAVPAPGGEALPIAPTFRSTICSSNADCPPDQICCYPCGIPDCNFICMTPWRKGMCPPVS